MLPAWRCLAEIAFNERTWHEAVKARDGHLLRGHAHLAERDTTEAIQEFQKGLKAVVLLAEVNTKSGAARPAIEELERFLARGTRSWRAKPSPRWRPRPPPSPSHPRGPCGGAVQITYLIRFAWREAEAMPGYLPRHLVVTARRALAMCHAVLVTGARQSGKTTLLRTEFGERFRYISLERPDVRTRALADPLGLLAEHAAPLILEEIQYAPELLHHLKEQIDLDRRPGQ